MTIDTARLKHFQQHHEKQKQLFKEAARENVIVRRCLEIASSERLPEEWAWLEAAMALLEQNRQLFENATVLMNTQIPAPIVGTKEQVEKLGFSDVLKKFSATDVVEPG